MVWETGPKKGTKLPSCKAVLQKNSTGFETTDTFPPLPATVIEKYVLFCIYNWDGTDGEGFV